MSISDNVRTRMQEGSWIRRMFEEGTELKKRYGEDKVFDLSLGNPVIEPPPEFHKELKRLVENPSPGMHRYMENAGYLETRAAVAEQLSRDTGVGFTPDHIVMTCGAAGGLNVVLKTLLNQGEEVVIFAPYFAEFLNYIDNHGGITKVLPTDENFLPRLDILGKAISSKTKAVLINSPNNPTGVVYPENLIRQLGDLLGKKETEFKKAIYLISDEAYRKIVYDGLKCPSVFHHHPNSIAVTSHSKDLALPGERIGYIAVHPDCYAKDELIAGLIFSNRTLGFVNAPALMQHAIRRLQNVTVSVADYQRKRDFLYSHLVEMGFSVVKPQGAFYMFPKSPIEDELIFIDELKDRNILVVPGRGFGTAGYFRISYCVEDKVLESAMKGFKEVAKKYGLTKSR